MELVEKIYCLQFYDIKQKCSQFRNFIEKMFIGKQHNLYFTSRISIIEDPASSEFSTNSLTME